MVIIRNLFQTLVILFSTPSDSKHAQRLPPALEAERLQLLLSCGF
jgi:hypothetical protein